MSSCNNPKQSPVSSATVAASRTSSSSPSLSAASSMSSSSTITTAPSVGASTTSPSISSSTSTYTPNPTCDPDPRNLVQNPHFECGLAPWVAYDTTSSHSIESGAYVYFGSGPYVPHGPSPPSLSQQIAVTVGQAYTLTFQTYFVACTGKGTIEVLVDGSSAYTVTDCDFTAGAFQPNTVHLTATKSPLSLEFDFENYAYYTFSMTMKISNGMYIFRSTPSCKT